MTAIWLVLAFALFMAVIWSVYALNRVCVRRTGSEPFSLPNAALMLVVNLLLLSALSAAADGQGGFAQIAATATATQTGTLVKLIVAGALALWLFTVIARRNGVWIALYAVPLMAVAAIAILPSLVFRYLALAAEEQDGS
ncbi:MAG: hypothetical protein WBM40_02130 [Thiohalocapsa sp.]